MYVINGIGGRLDQTLANINTLFSDNGVSIYLMSEDSLCFVLEPVCYVCMYYYKLCMRCCDVI